MGKELISPRQLHLSLTLDSFATPRSQCRLRKMGTSENAQNRWVLILALPTVRAKTAYRARSPYLCSFISAINRVALATTASDESIGAVVET